MFSLDGVIEELRQMSIVLTILPNFLEMETKTLVSHHIDASPILRSGK